MDTEMLCCAKYGQSKRNVLYLLSFQNLKEHEDSRTFFKFITSPLMVILSKDIFVFHSN